MGILLLRPEYLLDAKIREKLDPEIFTGDLHRSGYAPNYVSEHEEKYTSLGVPIKFGLFRMRKDAPDFDPTRFRLTPGVKREAISRLLARPAAAAYRDSCAEAAGNA